MKTYAQLMAHNEVLVREIRRLENIIQKLEEQLLKRGG